MTQSRRESTRKSRYAMWAHRRRLAEASAKVARTMPEWRRVAAGVYRRALEVQ